MKTENLKKRIIEGAKTLARFYRAKPLGVRAGLGALIIVLIVAGFFVFARPGSERVAGGATYIVRRGDLPISVVERGSLKAARSVNIISEVEGQSRIIDIVPEGTFVKEGDLLVELDSAELQERLIQQEISFQNAQSHYAQAEAAYEIQINQSESNVKAAELKVKFARLDLEKYLGSEVVSQLEEGAPLESIDVSKVLGGQALQRRRELESGINLAKAEEKRAGDKKEGTRRLAEAGYVTRMELEADKLDLERKVVALQQAEAALEIFRKYEFPREREKLYSDHEEAQRELERVRAKAESENSRAKASMLAAEATFKLQESRLEKRKEHLAKTSLTAPHDGMLIYASSVNPSRRFGSAGTLIEPGATVRYRQELISLPDTSSMEVAVSVHESFIDKIKPELEALVTVDAFPGKKLKGRVTKVALLPNSPMRWFNPDIKVYPTDVALDESLPGLKPGMSAEVEIILAQLKDVLSVPIQAVSNRGGENICWVVKGGKIFERQVEVGLASDRFAEIRSGLKEGERVLLAPPKGSVSPRKAKVRERARKEESPKPQTRPSGQEETKKEISARPKEEALPLQTGPPVDRKAMREYIKQLPPEKREEVLKRLKEAREKASD